MSGLNAGTSAAILVALCATVSVLVQVQHVNGALHPWWCRVNTSEDNLLKLVESTLEEMIQLYRFANNSLLDGHVCNSSDCDNVSFPPSPFAGCNDSRLLANALWDLSVLHFAYQSLLGQQLWKYTTKEFAQLETFGILLHHSSVATERLLRADWFLCGSGNYNLEYPNTQDWTNVTSLVSRIYCPCTQQCLLDNIIKRVQQISMNTQSFMIRHYLNDSDPVGAAWYMCGVRNSMPSDSCA